MRSNPTTVPAPRLLVHRTIQPIRWGAMDALGHVDNTVCFRFMVDFATGRPVPLPERLAALSREPAAS